jgi:hypothetical protein
MTDPPTDGPEAAQGPRILPGPGHLRHYAVYNLIAWQPEGILDDRLLDQIGDWLCSIERTSPPFDRYIDLSRLTEIAVRTNHVFDFARKRAEQLAGAPPMKSALYTEDWVGFGISRMYESLMEGTPIDARAFRDRAKAAIWLEVPAQILKLEDKAAPLS